MHNILKSNKGIFLSMIAYPVFILILGLSIAAFLDSTNNSRQVRITSSSLQAQYYAFKGMEYAFCEIKKSSYSDRSPFITHTVNSQTNELLDAADPTTLMPNTRINADGCYELASGNNKFEVKVYKKGDATYILSKGSSGNSTRLLVNKITGTSLFEYFSFFPGNTAFGWQTLDAKGGKIRTNGDITFYNGSKLLNLSELSSYGKMQLAYYPSVLSGEESTWFSSRWPYVKPNQSATPPIQPYGPKDFVNKYDGHYTGQLSGLYTKNMLSSAFVPWNTTTPTKPIYPWGPGPDATWDTTSDNSYIYEQANVNCLVGNTCANGSTNNQNYYSDHPQINGVYIPGRIPNAQSYTTYKYSGHTSPGDPTIPVTLTNSEQQAASWQSFINSFPSTIDPNAKTVTGLKDIVKAGPSNGAQYVPPPSVDVQDLISQARDSGKGMAINFNTNSGQIEVTINSNSPMTFAATNGTSFTQTCGNGGRAVTLFTHRKFINNDSGLPNEAVEVNVDGLRECEAAAQSAGQWLPQNGLVYSNYNLALANANQLPTNGLTPIVSGNLILKGQYNYPSSGDPVGNPGTWIWQPSTAVVSNYVYLASDGFSYPSTLPVTQRHKEYPNSESHGMSTLPAGIGTGATKDYVSGYNWVSIYDNQMASKVTTGASGGAGNRYYYNISLIGTYAPFPRYLERWGYYTSPGTAFVPPVQNSWVEYKAVVIGNFIQLTDDQFPPVGNLDSPNYRYCDQAGNYPASQRILSTDINGTIPFSSLNYPCRNSAGSTPDLLVYFTNEEKRYEPNYSANHVRPPGDFGELSSSIVLELPFSPTYWNFHNSALGS